NGKKVGINQGSYQIGLFKKWEESNGVSTELIELNGTEDEVITMLEHGDIDMYVGVEQAYDQLERIKPIATIGSSDFFFVVNKSNPELAAELNNAMNQIYRENPAYNSQLKEKYSQVINANVFLSTEEEKWLDEHGTIRVGYRDGFLPFCSTDAESGKLTGALKDFLDQASHCMKNKEIRFDAIPYNTISEAQDALDKGVIDCIFPMNLSDYECEKKGIETSSPVMQTEVLAVVSANAQQEFDLRGDVVTAVDNSNPNYKNFLMDCFPSWKLVDYQDIDSCFSAVASGEADCVLINSYRLNSVSNRLETWKLTTVKTGETMGVSFATNQHETTLYSIMNKVIHTVPSSSINAALAAYSYVEQPVTFTEFVRQNIFVVLIVVTLVIAVILLLWIHSVRSEQKTREAMKHIEVLNGNLSDSHEKLKEALEAAEQASRAKTSFLSNMSHEIRTPMNAIIGLDRLALKEENLPENTREQLEKIGASADHLLGIINDILDMSRIEAGHIELKDEPFSFTELIDQINVMIQGQCTDKNLQYECNVIGETEDYYVGDAMKLKQVLINILGNAVKFTDAPGSVTFSVEQTAAFEDYHSLRFIIRDTGIGMSKDYIPRIFEAFSQEKEGTSNQYGSTGLGMAITKSIVTMMNGEILVDSEKGKGTTFTVTVTLKAFDRSAGEDNGETVLINPSETVPAASQDGGVYPELVGSLVLVAEDMEINAEILMALLGTAGIRSERAENGRNAVDMFTETPENYYDAILMDVRMPVMDGLEATRTIRSLNRQDAKQIPIIAMTANAFDEDVRKSMHAGMNAHLTKPVNPENLFNTLAHYLIGNE
ncbi:MAG: response regulator, partial [Eubacterium sp.]|nr:response regulator [Eubacterium sp.]